MTGDGGGDGAAAAAGDKADTFERTNSERGAVFSRVEVFWQLIVCLHRPLQRVEFGQEVFRLFGMSEGKGDVGEKVLNVQFLVDEVGYR